MSAWYVIGWLQAIRCCALGVSFALSYEVPDMSTAHDHSADRETWEQADPDPDAEALGYSQQTVETLRIHDEHDSRCFYDPENPDAWVQSTLVIELGSES